MRFVEVRHLLFINEYESDAGVLIEALGVEYELGQHQQLVGDDRLVLLVCEEDVHPSPSSAASSSASSAAGVLVADVGSAAALAPSTDPATFGPGKPGYGTRAW